MVEMSGHLSQQTVTKVLRVFRSNFQPIPLEVYTKPYEVLVSTLLSARTKDETTFAACERLFAVATNINELKELKALTLEKLVYPVGFYKTKSRHLLLLAKMVADDFNGEIPTTREELMLLPGVGRKTANLVLQRLGLEQTIAVDTHVHKISNLLGWVDTKTPQETEMALMKVLPQKYWHDINSLFVSIGQQYRNEKKLIKFLSDNNLL